MTPMSPMQLAALSLSVMTASLAAIEMDFIGQIDQSTVVSSFDYPDNKTVFSLIIFPELPSFLTEEEKALLTKYSTPEGAPYWVFSCPQGGGHSHVHETARVFIHPNPNHPQLYTLARRTIPNGKPCSITSEACATLIRGAQVLLYTGAGISAGAVPTMNQILERLDLIPQNLNQRQVHIHSTLNNPEKYHKAMDDFYQACNFGQPTAAHWSLAHLSEKFSWPLLTENLDQLHQITGIEVRNRTSTDSWYKQFFIEPQSNTLLCFDFIIAIGLSNDESGLLEWYKKQCPSVRIVAINLEQPPYLDDNDLFVKGDAQVVLPEIEKHIMSKEPRNP